ncbi:TraR/DksA family transcriptional regulator [Salmonella enterica]|nr:TraR/DksA family transcriptional regulator [Salmonella enterica]EBA9765173.1 TraR/DksA family transcriptional regulator [Salmonella enterica]EEB5698908.1 hypothetical protein [Salmonella enterica]EGX5147330.1 TraR/DksA family transcriptional regulator [Salmonella enterica]EHQ9355014.1 TraR/DksA family transcriptional regulator [Salmonella enterica]
MADNADFASEYEALRVNDAVEKIRRLCDAGGQSELFCVDCGIRIPERRRMILPGVVMCVSCQEVIEYRKNITG